MVVANYTGTYPNLCVGEWTLKVNGKDVSDKIPEELRSFRGASIHYECLNGMNTYGTYRDCGQCEEDTTYYEDGLECNEWIEENAYWLDTITTDYNIQVEIYQAINEHDWRKGSCGGCI